MTSKVKLLLPPVPSSGGRIEVDGHDVAKAVRSLRLSASANSMTQLELDLVAMETEYEGEAMVYVSPATAWVLARYGWMPPSHAKVRSDGGVWLGKPVCTCQQVDVSTPLEPKATMRGRTDPGCPEHGSGISVEETDR